MLLHECIGELECDDGETSIKALGIDIFASNQFGAVMQSAVVFDIEKVDALLSVEVGDAFEVPRSFEC